ncbi:MAG: hypothetical protein P8Z30_16765, partial [Acidobacteriota bacterium]
MRISIESRTAQRTLMVLLLVGFVLATVWIARAYFADRAGHTLSVESLERASRLNPGDATYHVQLGRLYQYSVTNPRPKMAIRQFQEAVKASPYDPQAWINLAAAYEFQGDTSKA